MTVRFSNLIGLAVEPDTPFATIETPGLYQFSGNTDSFIYGVGNPPVDGQNPTVTAGGTPSLYLEEGARVYVKTASGATAATNVTLSLLWPDDYE